jgi:hypothetical protein
MQFEQKGLNYGPITSGAQGSLFLAIYDRAPNFIEATRGEKETAPDSDYEARAA